MSALPARSIGVGSVSGSKGVTSIVARPIAAVVASMLRAMYGALLLRLVRLHLEPLHELRVDRAGHHGDQRPEARRRAPAAPSPAARC